MCCSTLAGGVRVVPLQIFGILSLCISLLFYQILGQLGPQFFPLNSGSLLVSAYIHPFVSPTHSIDYIIIYFILLFTSYLFSRLYLCSLDGNFIQRIICVDFRFYLHVFLSLMIRHIDKVNIVCVISSSLESEIVNQI